MNKFLDFGSLPIEQTIPPAIFCNIIGDNKSRCTVYVQCVVLCVTEIVFRTIQTLNTISLKFYS